MDSKMTCFVSCDATVVDNYMKSYFKKEKFLGCFR